MSANRAQRRHPRRYEWPMVTVVHPDHGSYRLHIHGTRPRSTGVLTLVVFGNGANSVQQCDVVFSTAAGTNSDVVQLGQEEITEDLGLFLAAKIHAEPVSTRRTKTQQRCADCWPPTADAGRTVVTGTPTLRRR
jgi:hypothetical protein